jgi:nicotinate-nucleotide adenylyltransferase
LAINSAAGEDKIGLFGGTFDPIHIGHILIAEWILNFLGLSKIIFIPNKIHPFFKRENITAAEKRAEMIRMVTDDFPFFEISTIEIEREGISYTIDTIRDMSRLYPGAEIYYIIGEDNLHKFELWKDSEKILKMAKVVTFRRGNSGKFDLKSKQILTLNSPLFDISSTDVRMNIKENKKYQSLVYPKVYQYIEDNNLYR